MNNSESVWDTSLKLIAGGLRLDFFGSVVRNSRYLTMISWAGIISANVSHMYGELVLSVIQPQSDDKLCTLQEK